MCLKTWKAEFYPVEASDVPESEAAEHSLRKWIGLRKENLERHGCGLTNENDVYEEGGDALSISATSCALCVHHFDTEPDVEACNQCPLKLHLGDRCDNDDGYPWNEYMNHDDPEPMIAALTAVVAKQKARTQP